ncbi:Hypothetical protein, putative [Bodo saltans]|uniref:Chromo domain-containing protein n=1 Tax=Bodo saltans TaxID=75058 RepID=A0A0S4KGE9_BODSA|nr:Hypothetical protein, putative [Bodo saltans]|eukprot:CUI14747.1 Hypothetical protein, putative [Bodo saltans]
MVLSGNATPRHSSSPQRYIGPSGRILCSLCDEGSRAVATGYCEECRRDGEECWFCDKCWKGEHASKRNRQHRKGPVPIPSGSSVTPRASFLHHAGDAMMDLLPFDTAALNPEARAYLMLQQQLIAAFTKANGGNVTSIRQLEPAETDDAGTQTVERIQSTYFDEAMVELQDVREQLEAEVYHSQVLIDSTRVQLLEALELRHRAEIETMCWRKYLTVKRPPQVVVLYDPSFIPPALEGLLQQKSGAPTTIAKMAMSGSSVVRTNSPPNVHITSPPVRKRNATNSQGVQCRLPPTASHATTNTEHSGDEPAPVKSVEEGSFKPRYTEDAVELVHGEKHLPDQPQMLLVRWRHGGLESWIPAYEVAHCGAVIAYLSRYDKTLVQNEGEDQQGGTDDATGSALQNRHSSPLAESERSKFAEELAALKRTGTATGSRESTDQQILPSNTQRVPQRQRPVNVPQKGTGTVEPSVQRPPLAPPAPSSRNVVVEEDALISLVEEERRDTPSDEELKKKSTVEPSVQRPPLAPPAPSSRNVVVEEDALISLFEEERRDTPSDEELPNKCNCKNSNQNSLIHWQLPMTSTQRWFCKSFSRKCRMRSAASAERYTSQMPPHPYATTNNPTSNRIKDMKKRTTGGSRPFHRRHQHQRQLLSAMGPRLSRKSTEFSTSSTSTTKPKQM